MKKYKLVKDLPTFKAGETFELWDSIETQGLCRESDGVMAYHQKTLEKFPNILTDWFEEIKSAEPLIKDVKIRKAVRAWAEANEVVKAFVVMNKNMNWIVYGDDIDRNRFMIEFFDRVVSENDETKNYTIEELCGEEEE